MNIIKVGKRGLSVKTTELTETYASFSRAVGGYRLSGQDAEGRRYIVELDADLARQLATLYERNGSGGVS